LGHLTKPIKPYFFVDLFGGYGQNKQHFFTVVAPNTETQQQAQAKNHSHNWFVSLTGLYNTTWKKFIVTGALSVLHNEVKQNSLLYLFQPNNQPNLVEPIRNKSTYILENAEIGYKVNETVQPFINGGLIQVVQFRNSRALLEGTVVSTAPELNLDQNGYQVGAGVSFSFKKAVLRVEQQHSQRARVYHSNLSIVSLRIAID
jgi:hypothetical protein